MLMSTWRAMSSTRGDVSTEANDGHIDNRADAGRLGFLQTLDGFGDAELLVPVLVVGAPDLQIEDEEMLVHERDSEGLDRHRAAHRAYQFR
jgi:hypothetical protein